MSPQKAPAQQLDPVPLSKLLGGKKYAWISHAGETYLLQLTKSNKLLLDSL